MRISAENVKVVSQIERHPLANCRLISFGQLKDLERFMRNMGGWESLSTNERTRVEEERLPKSQRECGRSMVHKNGEI